VERFEAAAYANPAVRTVFSQVGRYHTLFGEIDARNRAEFHVVVDNEAQHTAEVIDQLRPALSRAIPGAELLLKELGGGESAIRDDFMVDIYGPDPVVLAGLAEQVIEAFEAQPNISDVSATGDEFSTEIQVFPDRARVARAGLDPAQLGLLLRVAIEGDVEARLREGDDEYAIRVRLREQERLDAAGVAATTIQTASGAQIPLRELARVEEVLTPSLISRQERVRRATVTANLAWGASADTTEAVRALLDDPPEGYTIRIGGEEEQRTEAVGEISAALLLAIVLTTMLLAGLLESFSHPFAILSTLPLALVGVLVALAATGVPLDIFGLMALVMLVGIVVNNAILMLEETGHQRREGVPIHEALERGALLRLRPILMTSLSTVAGMVPLALALGPGAELRQAMALVSIGGVAVSSVLILIACPVIYSLIESAKRGLRLG